MGQDRIEPAIIDQLFAEAPFIGDSGAFVSSMETLHHLYLQMKLSPDQSKPDVDLGLLADGAYYLSALATTSSRRIALEQQQLLTEALSIAAMIFEYLGDLSREEEYQGLLEDSALYYLDACICNTLGIYESNSMTIARRRLLSHGTVREVLETYDSSDVVRLCHSIAYTWLGRQFRSLWWRNERQIRDAIDASVQELERSRVRGNLISSRIRREVRFWVTLGQALLEHAQYYQFGNESSIARANDLFAGAKEIARHHISPDYYWTASALQECAQRMRDNSVWNLLGDILPRRYVRTLVAGAKSVYELWTSQREALKAGRQTSAGGNLTSSTSSM